MAGRSCPIPGQKLSRIAPSQLRVSTITAIGGVNACVNLERFFEKVKIYDESHDNKDMNAPNSDEKNHDARFMFVKYASNPRSVKTAPNGAGPTSCPGSGYTYGMVDDDDDPGPRTRGCKPLGSGKRRSQKDLASKKASTVPAPATTKTSKTNSTRAELNRKERTEKKVGKKNRTFDNQATVVLALNPAVVPGSDIQDSLKVHDSLKLNLNIKVFKNGNVQITGIKDPPQGQYAIDCLVKELLRIYTDEEDGKDIVSDVASLANVNYQVCLVNTDFHLGIGVRRNVLHDMISSVMHSSFEPCIYPGVKIDYYFNDMSTCRARGTCSCSQQCSGRGRGHADGDCRKVTIAVFQSGCVIITGAHTLQQVHWAYDCITRFVDSVYDDVVKRELPLPSVRPASLKS